MRKQNFIIYKYYWKSTAPFAQKNAEENEKRD
jgi:hypothetical protein